MPGLGRKRSIVQDDSASDGSSSSAEDGLPSGKRVRTNSHPVLPSSYRSDVPASATLSQAHQPGSIVRVALKNFVTYTWAEFLPGPSLNMVIGPNGTGKSTLVCAICLGLGGKPDNLGRAKDVGEFVKHGAAEATVEIELAADPARQEANPVIKAVIKKAENKIHYRLDGRNVRQKDVITACKALNIQVDNLCQFLPQDRVVEFAALQPVDLLTETLRAIAPLRVIEQHKELKKHDAELKKAEIEETGLSANLTSLEARHNLQRPDVERAQQRTQLEEEAHALDLYRPIVQFNAAKQKHQEIKDKKRTAQQELNRLQLEVEPALRVVNAKRDYRNSVEAAVQHRASVLKNAVDHADRLSQKHSQIHDRIVSAGKEIESEAAREKTLKQDCARIDVRIKNIEVRMKEAPPEFDAADYNEKLRVIGRDLVDLEDRAGEAKSQQRSCQEQVRERESRIERLGNDLTALHSHAGQQENKLKKASADTFKAWDWIQKNKDLFQGQVYGPPIVSCSVKDKKHAIFVESVMAGGDLLAITVTNQADFKLLQSKLAGDLRLSDIYIRSSSIELARYKSPMPTEELSRLGLDGYLIDLLEGPDAVLGMLCDNRGIHTSAVAFKNLSSEQYEAITRSAINSFVTPSETFTITRRREYGDRGASTRTRKLKPAQFFGDQQVDHGAEQEIKGQIRELKGEIEELKTTGDQHAETRQGLAQRHAEAKSAKTELQTEKDNKQKALSNYNALPTQLQTAKDKLSEINGKIRESFEARQTTQTRINEDTKEKAQNANMCALKKRALGNMYRDLVEAEVRLIEATSDLETLETRNEEVQQSLTQCEKDVEALKQEQIQARREAEVFIRQVEQMAANMTDRDKEIHEQQPNDMSIETLEAKIVALQARLEMVHEGNPHVMREYEARGHKIDDLMQKHHAKASEVGELKHRIQAIREEWEAPFDALIGQVNEAFGDNMSRINCAGHVEVLKADDLAEWAILIKVKFREDEPLSVLDSHRQSGGERAVSTIFYLMALQSLAKAPFRVVDEINQGMDPRNERLVHSRMVAVACAEKTSQYFLITPKLLPNLEYHPKMKVQCIASGEYLPADGDQLNFRALADKALALQAQRQTRVPGTA